MADGTFFGHIAYVSVRRAAALTAPARQAAAATTG